jgi:DNA-binding NtrC family response regulator
MLSDMNAKHDRQVRGVDAELLERLIAHDWPGNVRELRNTVERAVILCGNGSLEVGHLPPGFGHKQPSVSVGSHAEIVSGVHVEVGTTVDEAERKLIIKTLESTRNNKTRAAEILGISLKTLHNKLKEYGSATGMENSPERSLS